MYGGRGGGRGTWPWRREGEALGGAAYVVPQVGVCASVDEKAGDGPVELKTDPNTAVELKTGHLKILKNLDGAECGSVEGRAAVLTTRKGQVVRVSRRYWVVLRVCQMPMREEAAREQCKGHGSRRLALGMRAGKAVSFGRQVGAPHKHPVVDSRPPDQQ